MAGARSGPGSRPKRRRQNAWTSWSRAPVCSLVQHAPEHEPGTLAVCSRCGARLRDRKEHGLEYTLAFTLAALILYVPANLYPILRMEWYGAYSENTVWQGCQKLFEDGQWLVAAIVFLASIVIPLLKLLGLFFLVASRRFHLVRWQREQTWVYRFIDVIGPWAMLDVFLLSVLVTLVKLGNWPLSCRGLRIR